MSSKLNILRLVFMLTSCQWRNQQQPRGDQTWSATLLHSRHLHKGIGSKKLHYARSTPCYPRGIQVRQD